MTPGAEIKKVACFFCHNNCGVLVHVQDGKVTKVEGNPKHPVSRGFICPRATHAPRWLYHPDQLHHPLKRVGERGEGKWQRIPYEQALDDIAEKLSRLRDGHGAETLLTAEGTYRSDHFWARSRFVNLFGAPQNLIDPGTICNLNCYSINLAMVGSAGFQSDITKAGCVVLWGMNPRESRLLRWVNLKKRSRLQNLKIIIIDPRRTESLRHAHMGLQLRPGTDGALALGWIHVIIDEGLYDKAFVRKWTTGFDEVLEAVREYTPMRVAQITGLGREQIIDSARLYSTTRPACIERGVATDQLGLNSGRIEQARVILSAITGNLDVPGGNLVTGPPLEINGKKVICDAELELADKCPEAQRRKQIGGNRFKLMAWPAWETMGPYYRKHRGVPCPQIHHQIVSTSLAMRQIISEEPYPLKALITAASNPVIWAPNTNLVLQALTYPNLELHVVLDYWMTPTAQIADYVLPAASWLERPLCSHLEDFLDVVYTGERAIAPLGERREDFQFWRGLGIRLGQEAHWPWRDLEEVIKYRISATGMSVEEFVDRGILLPTRRAYRQYEKTGFGTPSGKVEFCPSVFRELGYEPRPFYEEPPESPVRTPELFKEYPLILNTGGRFMPLYHSEHRQWGVGLREMHPDPLLSIHPDTAQRLGIQNKDWVYIETKRGRIRQKANLTPDIPPGIVNAEASWWFPEKPGERPSLFGALESNANVLTIDDPDLCDPLTAGWCNRALLCKVYKV